MDDLDKLLLGRLQGTALTVEELEVLGRPHGSSVAKWLKRSVAAKRIYEHSVSEAGKRKKAYSTTPDVRKELAKVLTALSAALKQTAAQGISNEQVASVLLEALGVRGAIDNARVEVPDPAPAGNEKRGDFLGELHRMATERPREALLPVRDLRARLALTKEAFDELALELMRERAISLHHHDHPAALTEAERAQLVRDAGGNFYIGIAAARSGA